MVRQSGFEDTWMIRIGVCWGDYLAMQNFKTVSLPLSKCVQQMVSSLGAHQSDILPLLLCVEYVQTVLSPRKKGERCQVISFLPPNS